MKLLVDAGNTRIKWALVQGVDWLRSGVLSVAQADVLPQHLTGQDPSTGLGQPLPAANLRDIEQVWVSNVAGEEVARHIRDIGVGRNVMPHFVVAQAEQYGVRNGYAHAGQLGSDRWAALIAAWHMMREECLVVNCGTATTIDTLSAQGEFTGGLIMPGVELMQSSLGAIAARLTTGGGAYMPFPDNTADAVFSGAIQASCGAIQRQHALLSHDRAPVVLSGGAAGVLHDHLKMPLRVVDDLVLQGLFIIAQEASET